jgi:lipopolysaccharide/colanic/teichoic acid biosynthesis glycosyltransferase
LALEPFFSQKTTFAVTYFDAPVSSSSENINIPSITAPVQPDALPQRAHAPEPSTLFLILSGFTGIVVRFARRSFDKFKRVMDFMLAVAGLILTMPLLAFAALLIKLSSPGPIIYLQNRVGKDGEIFRIYKLRTMRQDAEKRTGAVWAKENDPRVTSVGRVLRKAHIDEIPQLLNVLKGEMSIVGPRPERPEMIRDLKTLIRDYEKRLQVPPGITGLAQVAWHRYDETIEDVKKKIKYDVLYIKKRRVLVDLRIMANTLAVVLMGKGAR